VREILFEDPAKLCEIVRDAMGPGS